MLSRAHNGHCTVVGDCRSVVVKCVVQSVWETERNSARQPDVSIDRWARLAAVSAGRTATNNADTAGGRATTCA